MLTPKELKDLTAKAAKAITSTEVEADFTDELNDGEFTPVYHGVVTLRFNGKQNVYGKYRYAFTTKQGTIAFSSTELIDEGALSTSFRVTREIDGVPTKRTYYTL
jgi:hypothetical protein